jgi:hypothetical protein
MALTEPFGQQLLIYRQPLNTINNVNDPVLCVSQLYGFDYIITDPRGGDNSVLQSEDLTHSTWGTSPNVSLTMNPSGIVGPYGNNSFLLDVLDNNPHFFQEAVSVLPSTEYTLSFYVMGTANPGAFTYSVLDLANANYLVTQSLYAAASNTTWSRIVVQFSTNSNTTSVQIYIIGSESSPGSLLISAPQVELGGSPAT